MFVYYNLLDMYNAGREMGNLGHARTDEGLA